MPVCCVGREGGKGGEVCVENVCVRLGDVLVAGEQGGKVMHGLLLDLRRKEKKD